MSSCVTSASSTAVKCTAVCTDFASASAIFRRTPRNGMRCETPSLSTGGRLIGAATARAANPFPAAGVLPLLAEGAASAKDPTSVAVTRPPRPVPSTRLISIESSFAIRRTAGVASDLPCGVFVDVVVARCSSSLRANRLATFNVPCILPTTVP